MSLMKAIVFVMDQLLRLLLTKMFSGSHDFTHVADQRKHDGKVNGLNRVQVPVSCTQSLEDMNLQSYGRTPFFVTSHTL
jgi:hypothetical protein